MLIRGGDVFPAKRVFLGVLACLAAFFLAVGCSGSEPAQEETEASTQPEETKPAREAEASADQPNII